MCSKVYQFYGKKEMQVKRHAQMRILQNRESQLDYVRRRDADSTYKDNMYLQYKVKLTLSQVNFSQTSRHFPSIHALIC